MKRTFADTLQLVFGLIGWATVALSIVLWLSYLWRK